MNQKEKSPTASYVDRHEEIAARVRSLIIKRGTTQTALGDALGLTRSGVHKLLTRDGALASHLERIADVLDVRLADLLGDKARWEVALSRATDMVDVTPGSVFLCCKPDRWVVAAGPALAAHPGDRVAIHLDGTWETRRYDFDSAGRFHVFHDPGDEVGPRVFPEDSAPEFRVILADASSIRKP